MSKNKDYWKDSLNEILPDLNIFVTDEQLNDLAVNMATCAEMQYEYDSYSRGGFDAGPSSEQIEIKKLKDELYKERNKRTCNSCAGNGRIISYFGSFQSDSECISCRGEGRK